MSYDEGLATYELYAPRVLMTRTKKTIEQERYSDPLSYVVSRGQAAKAKAIEYKQAGQDVKAGIQASAYMGISVVEGGARTVGAVAGAIMNPMGALAGLGYAATHAREVIGLSAVALAEDPVRVVGQVGGSILVGAVASDVVAGLRGPKTVKTVETKTVRKPRLSRGFSRTSFEPGKVVIHTDDFLGAHQVKAGGSWPKSGTTGLGKPHYIQTGEGLMETIPYSGGVEQTVYRLTTRVTRRPTQLRGSVAVTRTVTTQVPRSSSIMGPLVGVGIRPFSPLKPSPQLQYPDESQRTVTAVTSAQKGGLKQATEYRPVSRTRQELKTILPGYTLVPQIIRPISRTRITPVPLPPGYTQKLIPVSTSMQVPRQMSTQMQRIKTTSKQKGRPPTPFYIPQMRHVSLTAPSPAPRRTRRKKKGYDPLSLDIWGEMREYPVKTPKAVLKGLI